VTGFDAEEKQGLEQAFEIYLSRQEKQPNMQSGTMTNYARAEFDGGWSTLQH